MSETDSLSRKKKIRAAHRASATRMIAAVEDLLAADEELDIPKLKQKEQAIEGKTELLMKKLWRG